MTPSIVKTVPQLPARQINCHKGDFGRVLVVAGSLGMSGAAGLAGKAALRSGAGLVRIAAPAGIVPVIASYEPAYTTIPLPQDKHGKIGKQTAVKPEHSTFWDLHIIVARVAKEITR